MSSQRKQIRQNVVDRLKVAVSEVEDRVFNARAEAIGDIEELPCICVYTRDEPVETVDARPALQIRSLALAVEIIVAGSGNIEDSLDDIAEKVESEMLSSLNQNPSSGLFAGVELENTELAFLDSGRKPIGAARLTFRIGYEKRFN